MLQYNDITEMLSGWKSAGLPVPVATRAEAEAMISTYLGILRCLTKDELQELSARVRQSNRWPTMEILKELRKEVAGRFLMGEDFSGPYDKQEEETDYKRYVVRLGRALFPRQEEAWYLEHPITVRVLYHSAYSCQHCEGVCPYGNKLLPKVNKEQDMVVPIRLPGQCSRFKYFTDDPRRFTYDYRKEKRAIQKGDSIEVKTEEDWEKHLDENAWETKLGS